MGDSFGPPHKEMKEIKELSFDLRPTGKCSDELGLERLSGQCHLHSAVQTSCRIYTFTIYVCFCAVICVPALYSIKCVTDFISLVENKALVARNVAIINMTSVVQKRPLAWPGLAWLGLAWNGLEWPGMAWPGLAWPGLA